MLCPGQAHEKGQGLGSLPKPGTGNGGSAQAMGDGMTKNEGTKKATTGASIEKERIKRLGPSVQTILTSFNPHNNAVAQGRLRGRTKVVLLPVDPYMVHVYWELDPMGPKQASKALGKKFLESQSILRFYDVTNIVFDGTNASNVFDISVDLLKPSCYIHLRSPQKTYIVDLGWRTQQGQFYCLGRSNTVHTPSPWPAQGGAHLPAQSTSVPGTTKGLAETDNHNTLCSAKKHEAEERPAPLDSNKAAPLTSASSTTFSKSHVDLSAMSENAFESGMSSAQTPSSPNGRDGRED